MSQLDSVAQSVLASVSLRNSLLVMGRKSQFEGQPATVREFRDDGRVVTLKAFSNLEKDIHLSASLDSSLVFSLECRSGYNLKLTN